jgi:hypothetical protein
MISLFVLGVDGEVSGDILRIIDILIQESRAQRVPAEKTSKLRPNTIRSQAQGASLLISVL